MNPMSGDTLRLGRVLRTCLRRLPIVIVFTGLVTAAAFVVLQHLPPVYSARSVVWLGSRESAILASQSAWSTVGRVTGSVEDGRTVAAVLSSVPVLRRVAISLKLYERPEALESRFSAFVGSLQDSFFPSEAQAEPASHDPSQPIEVSSLQSDVLSQSAFGAVDGSVETPDPLDPNADPAELEQMEAALRFAVAAIADKLDVTIDTRSEIAIISFSAPDAELAARVVNEVPKAFAAERRARMRDGSTGAAKWLAERVEDARRDVAATEQKIERVRAEHGLFADTKDSEAQQLITRLSAEADAARTRLLDAQVKLDRGRAEVDSNATNTTLFTSAVMDRLIALRADAVGKRREFLTRVSEEHGVVRDIDAKIAGLDKDINAEKHRLLGDFEVEVATAEAAVKAADTRLENARKQFATAMESNAEAEASIASLQRDLDADRAHYRSLLGRLQEARQVAQVEDDGISVIQAALPSKTPSIIGPPLLVTLAGFASFFFGMAVVALLAIIDRRIVHPDQVRAAGLSTIVSAPRVPKSGRSSRRPAFMFKDAIRRLFATTLYRGVNADMKRTVLVTSGSTNEGKTTVARALATFAAATGTSTVLVEGDLRRPGRHNRQLPRTNTGVVGLIEGRATLDEVLIPEVDDGPAVLPVTIPAQHSTELLASANMREILKELRERYDFVVIDTPPLCLAPDCELLAPYADAVVFVIRHGSSTIDRTHRSLDLLETASSPQPVAFVNRADSRFFRETYGPGASAYPAQLRSTGKYSWRTSLFGRRAVGQSSAPNHRFLSFTKRDFAKELHS